MSLVNPKRKYRFYRGETLVGIVTVVDSDQPYFCGRIEPAEGYGEIVPLLDRLALNRRQSSSPDVVGVSAEKRAARDRLAWKPNDTAVVTKLRPFVVSVAYQNVASNGPTYECLARLRQTLDAPPLDIADAYLKASWQVEASPARCQTFLQAALTNYLARTSRGRCEGSSATSGSVGRSA